MDRLKDKVCIVTGAARGMGKAIAEDLLKEGGKVVFADLSEDVMQVAQVADKNYPGCALGVKVNVVERDQVQQMIAQAVERFGRLDVMFNNAGVNKPKMLLDLDKDNWDFIMDVNAWAVVVGTQEAAKQMIKQGKGGAIAGKIINTASVASRQAYVDITAYAASKFAVVAITQAAARNLAEHNITVNGFAPGVVATPLWDQLDKDLMEIGMGEKIGDARANFAKNIIRGRVATEQDIIGTTTFLASSDSDYMTAQIVMIDGGITPI